MQVKYHISFVLILLLSVSALAGDKNYGTAVVSKVIRVYDGDTFIAAIDTFAPLIGDSIRVRISGIDAPELRSHNKYERDLAKKAKLYTENRLKTATVVTLKNMKRDKYFRILADVYVDRWNLGKELIRVGLAIEYNGGRKLEW